MKLAAPRILVVLALARGAAIAHAEPALDEYGAGAAPGPFQQLVQTGCEVDVELRGAAATVELRQRIVNPGPGALAASYEFELPQGAALIGAAIELDGAPEPAIAVPAQFSTTAVDSAGVLGPDPLIVVAVPTGGAPRYRAVIQPIGPGHEIALTTRYATVAELFGGGLHLVLPGRPSEAGFAACRGAVRATPGPGARVAGIRITGTAPSPRQTAAFTLGVAPAAIDVDLALASAAPIVWTQTENLGVGWSATLVTVVAPPARARTGDSRALFVIDGSRSMELVGAQRVVQVMRAAAAALPSGTEVDAIVYDRTAARVLGEFRPATAATLAALEAGVRGHPAGNGSDLVAAFALAHAALDGARGQTMVVVISDGVLGDGDGAALTQALDGKTQALDVHAIILDPARTRSPSADAIRGPVNRYGGTLVEIDGEDLDRALARVDDWLRPAALELALGSALGPVAIPDQVRAGGGFTRSYLHRDAAPVLTLTGHGEAAFRVVARPGPAAPIAQLALAASSAESFAGPDPSDAALASARQVRARARARNPAADADHAFAALARAGRVAASRRAMIRGGGPYERTVALADPGFPAPAAGAAPSGPAPSAIARLTLERLFRDQLAPRAYACYQRALGRSPRLVGTAYFEFHIGRGEVSQVGLTGLGDAAFDACLVDAGYALQPPLPDFTINADDQTVARYPLSFSVRDDHPMILPGDADSSSPLDIDAIQGGVPERRRPIRVDASTPLGGLPRHP
jgi:Mg-chelatase subunit ChlD